MSKQQRTTEVRTPSPYSYLINEVANFSQGDFYDPVVPRICATVVDCIRSNQSFTEQINQEADAIFVKSVEGQVIVSNRAYGEMFSREVSPVGRFGESYLAKTVAEVSKHSDALIISGCAHAQFIHAGHDALGREVLFQSYKRTLLGLGHPNMAILGITRLLEVVSDPQAYRMNDLGRQWATFSQLRHLDRSIAISLARGESVSAIAEQHGVTKKTIENHRATMLKSMDLKTPLELVKLLVRLQENGFGDLGV